MHVDGAYAQEEEVGVVTLTHGYSRDRRPDLNQIMLNLIVEQRAGLPLLMQPLSGNCNDTASFGALIERHIDNLNATHQVEYWIADSALYSEANLQILAAHRGRWITRVPERLRWLSAIGMRSANPPSYSPVTAIAAWKSSMGVCASAG
ncbi:MAG: IS1634 family transposase [Gammaproteobacteria bacterium]